MSKFRSQKCWPRTSQAAFITLDISEVNTRGLSNYIIFDEIFNKFAAAKARKLCLWSRIITRKALQVFSAKLLLVGVMEAAKKVIRLSGLCSRTLKSLLHFLFRFLSTRFHIYPTSYIYVAHICIFLSKLQSVLHNQHYKDH